jgi:hypothetical protein
VFHGNVLKWLVSCIGIFIIYFLVRKINNNSALVGKVKGGKIALEGKTHFFQKISYYKKVNFCAKGRFIF